jgi:hypothetical protein
MIGSFRIAEADATAVLEVCTTEEIKLSQQQFKQASHIQCHTGSGMVEKNGLSNGMR